MANYFVYLASGLASSYTSTSLPPVRLTDVYEDGQGRGKTIAACSPAFDFSTDPPHLLGVHCASTSYEKFEAMPNFLSAWAAIKLDRVICKDVQLTWPQLEELRSKSQYTYTCDANTQGTSLGNATNPTDDDTCPCSYGRQFKVGYNAEEDKVLCDLDEGGSCCGWGPGSYFMSNTGGSEDEPGPHGYPGECTFAIKGAGWWLYLLMLFCGGGICGTIRGIVQTDRLKGDRKPDYPEAGPEPARP